MKLNKKRKITIIVLSLLLLVGLTIMTLAISFSVVKKNKMVNLDEKGLPIYQKPIKKNVENADYYIDGKKGNDTNNGTKDQPFQTIQKAQDTIRNLIRTNSPKVNKDITIAIMGGEYNLASQLSFNSQDNLPNNHRLTYTSYNNNEVILSGGINFRASEFQELIATDKARISEEARSNVKVINLFDKGINAETIGKLYAIGGFSQGRKYGEDNGVAIELFYDGKRMELAKYPNTGFTKIGDIVDYGEASEHVPDIIDWSATLSPRPPKFRVDDDMKQRMSRWQKPTNPVNDFWTYGYFYWDWADVSSPLKDFDPLLGQLDLKYSSPYGIKKDGLYLVYNVLEELDTMGEYYLDRETGNLYIYLPKNYDNNSRITLSLLNKSIIHSYEANNIIIDGMTIECGRTQAINMNGNNITISNVLVRNVAAEGIRIQGFNNTISDTEVTNVGRSGIVVGKYLNYKEGNITQDIRKDGLKVENNVVKNCYIHNYGETFKSGIAGVNILGVGNKVMHNEIFDAPYTGILYAGNEHIIEYNYIHHVVKMSSDAGAIYSGRNLSYFGNIIRFNAIFDIGSNEFTPNGIYFDDCLAGQTAYGNIIVNVPGNGFLIGGGREHNIYDNLIINARDSIRYDARAYEGLSGGWYKNNVNTPNARQWNLMRDAQALYTNWLKDPISKKLMKKSIADYSTIMKMVGFDKRTETNSACTPNGRVHDNIILSKDKRIGVISDAVIKYAKLENNNLYDLNDNNILSCFTDFGKQNFSIKKGSLLAKENKNYKLFPYHLIGRIND